MRVASIEAIATVLNHAGVRYIVVGELAVVAHGYLRAINGLQIWVEFVPENLAGARQGISSLGYQPLMAATEVQLSDRGSRAQLASQLGSVLAFRSAAHRETALGLLLEEPASFQEEYLRAPILPLGESLSIRVVSRDTLLAMKLRSGRLQDLADAEHLVLAAQKPPRTDRRSDEMDWTLTTFEGVRQHQLQRSATTSLRQKLVELEEMARLGERLTGGVQ